MLIYNDILRYYLYLLLQESTPASTNLRRTSKAWASIVRIMSFRVARVLSLGALLYALYDITLRLWLGMIMGRSPNETDTQNKTFEKNIKGASVSACLSSNYLSFTYLSSEAQIPSGASPKQNNRKCWNTWVLSFSFQPLPELYTLISAEVSTHIIVLKLLDYYLVVSLICG